MVNIKKVILTVGVTAGICIPMMYTSGTAVHADASTNMIVQQTTDMQMQQMNQDTIKRNNAENDEDDDVSPNSTTSTDSLKDKKLIQNITDGTVIDDGAIMTSPLLNQIEKQIKENYDEGDIYYTSLYTAKNVKPSEVEDKLRGRINELSLSNNTYLNVPRIWVIYVQNNHSSYLKEYMQSTKSNDMSKANRLELKQDNEKTLNRYYQKHKGKLNSTNIDVRNQALSGVLKSVNNNVTEQPVDNNIEKNINDALKDDSTNFSMGDMFTKAGKKVVKFLLWICLIYITSVLIYSGIESIKKSKNNKTGQDNQDNHAKKSKYINYHTKHKFINHKK